MGALGRRQGGTGVNRQLVGREPGGERLPGVGAAHRVLRVGGRSGARSALTRGKSHGTQNLSPYRTALSRERYG